MEVILMNAEFKKLMNDAADKYVRRRYYKNAWVTERKTFLAGVRFATKAIKKIGMLNIEK